MRNHMRLLLLLATLFTAQLWAGGDHAGEAQPPPRITLPPSPPLSPEDALKSFTLQPGFKIELVASEPLIHDPIAIAFDPDGRIWVVEYRAYMPDVDGNNEENPICTIAVLEDTDGDGKMDKRTEFLDKLYLPRAIGFTRGGILLAEQMPPKLFYCRDTNGDGKCDDKILIAADYGGPGNPEHTANGLMPGLDNWIYSADCNSRFRPIFENFPDAPPKVRAKNAPPPELFKRERTNNRGQWGISQDDFGRQYYNSNSDFLRVDLMPTNYLNRNPNYRGATGMNYQAMKDQSCWTGRPNIGVNRGYQAKQLRDDNRLATCTATCGVGVYRGDNLPADCLFNVFIPEPSGNMVKRVSLAEDGLIVNAKNVYDKQEFLTSTDERFRPVNTYTGPDGALYIVDLYRGILQHKAYVTTYLRKQIIERGLDKGLGLGRIYRIVNTNKAPGPKPALSKQAPAELVANLAHPNGWWRDTAQRLLVEKGDTSVVPALQTMALSGATSNAKIHALWTLDGLAQTDAKTILAAIGDKDPKVRATAIRVSDPLLKTPGPAKAELLAALLKMANDSDPYVQVQLACTLGEAIDPSVDLTLISLAQNGSQVVKDAAFSSMGFRELEILEKALADPKVPCDKTLTPLAGCVFNEGRVPKVLKLLDLIAAQTDASKQAEMLAGIGSGAVKAGTKAKTVEVGKEEPESIAKLKKSSDKKVAALAKGLDKSILWGANIKPYVPPTPLNAEQQALFDLGKVQFGMICAGCHQLHGMGEEGKAPPLVDSPFVLGNDKRLIRIGTQGVRGPITLNGATFNMEMPALPTIDPKTLAGILTYIRREWGHGADPVDPKTVEAVRKETIEHEEQWTEKELLKIK